MWFMPWNDIAPGDFGNEFRRALLAAIKHSYDENCRRFAPDDVGDNNISFSHTVRENLRFLLQKEIVESERLAGVIGVHWKGLIYELMLPGDLYVHIYKAPPGITDVRKLRFDGSKRQISILEGNADQLAMNFAAAAGEEAPEGIDGGSGRHVVVVHFGDPVDGLDKVIAGEPFLSELDAPDWIWIESLSEQTVLYERDEQEPDAVPSDEADDDDFDDLEMRDDAADDESRDEQSGTEGP
jgi:hypothetical protein